MARTRRRAFAPKTEEQRDLKYGKRPQSRAAHQGKAAKKGKKRDG